MRNLSFVTLILFPALAHATEFDLPIDCEVGKTCFVQNYVDQDNGAASRDYTCGSLSYEGHKGTDFRLRNLVQMREGVKVLAAADGVVVGTRNNVPDINIRESDPRKVQNIECGNGVRLDHPDGLNSQYCHLRQGSITVQTGQQVKRGDVLGVIGLSGLTEYPHLHYQLSRGSMILDPFVGEKPLGQCGGELASMWTKEAQAQLAYQPTGLLASGISDQQPDMKGAANGEFSLENLPIDAPAIVYWTEIFGVQAGDMTVIEIIRPNGETLIGKESQRKRTRAVEFDAIGARLRDKPWPPGTYKARYTLQRDGKTIVNDEREFEVIGK